MEKDVSKLSELIDFIKEIGDTTDNLLVYRGEKKDYEETALVPFVYRKNYISKEDIIYRESQRFNDDSFHQDKTTFDRLSRIQHYSAPTRLIDVSEDLLSAVYFAIAEKKELETDALIYIFEIKKNEIKYYDSDSVSVISNLSKIPLNGSGLKSKEKLAKSASSNKTDTDKFNNEKCVQYLLHEIRSEKPQFLPLIDPEDITSVKFVLPKFTSSRIKSQKGAFLLFGLNPDNHAKPIKIIKSNKLIESDNRISHPIVEIHIAKLKAHSIKDMQTELKNLGIKKSYIYPEIDKVSEQLNEDYQ
ncbi:FRG domain-containing protein [Parashewanella tropica]|uniref:FRG domain-containing protein n=1 Tax=Parashewanella tropica TaxID=2547970 RepID=UPI00105A72E9|nr:FRG domain-containing protein [Parashewanella tropica]